MGKKKTETEYTEAEAQRRFEQALKGALNTPPKPHKETPARGQKGRNAKDGSTLDGKASRPRHQD